MIQITIDKDSQGKEYKVTPYNTWYNINTDDKVIEVLERLRDSGIRITLDYGNVETGESWNDTYDITGYVGRSTGRVKIPILVHNKRSMGGSAILTDCILSIRYSNKKEGGYIYKRQ